MPERNEADPRVEKLIVERWSPRSYDESPMPQEDLEVIFEAAGWAPSAFNVQPWTFLYAHRGDENWKRFLSVLVEFNQGWAKNASVVLFIVSARNSSGPDGKSSPNHSHSFDAGAAWAMMALQSHAMGYHAHGMTGIDFEKAQAELGIPDDHRLEAAVAIGRKDAKEKLPEDLREKEKMSGRKPVSEIAIAGNFPED
ncbi:NAD(P)H-flavin oxidoreductase [Novosphingobium marinum]|uniref:Nitroreductase n=1 Tax=Novosphingobium marinum TaxID=1514948 RepID=A0A7Z0BVG4_9SPHN|nr:nitroreductase family protein [Novosphingobium marinum]NYH95167.1 nitroreductase [Novosphingobium marinum]GGC24851.1 NAD(P)H-flavin oxidoreductase [Novosphingobium marinum]